MSHPSTPSTPSTPVRNDPTVDMNQPNPAARHLEINYQDLLAAMRGLKVLCTLTGPNLENPTEPVDAAGQLLHLCAGSALSVLRRILLSSTGAFDKGEVDDVKVLTAAIQANTPGDTVTLQPVTVRLVFSPGDAKLESEISKIERPVAEPRSIADMMTKPRKAETRKATVPR